MNDFLELAFSSINLPLTCLIIILIIYWVLSMISGIDFDFDMDIDVDVDLDTEIDINSNIETGNATFSDASSNLVSKDTIIGKHQRRLKWWQIILIYFNFVGLPFMFTFTVFAFAWWTICMLATETLSSSENILGFITFFVAIIPALFITKVFTIPFKSFFVHLNKDGDIALDYIGKRGTSLSNISKDKMGRAEILSDGNAMNVYIKSLNGEEILYNQEILIIKQSTDKNFFYVKSYNE